MSSSPRARTGTVAWLEQSGGVLTAGERLGLTADLVRAFFEGIRLARHAKQSGKRDASLDPFAAPDTPMVNAARALLLERSVPPMARHCQRTSWWTGFVLNQHQGEVTPAELETIWVAGLLHDLGLEMLPARGDFTATGCELVKQLAHQHRWPEAQVNAACEAIVANLSAQVDAKISGTIAWAMNVGGLAELGFPLHRAQMSPARLAQLEELLPRDGMVTLSKILIAKEAARVPGGRFDFFQYVFPLIMRR